jgi:hypothetical protein
LRGKGKLFVFPVEEFYVLAISKFIIHPPKFSTLELETVKFDHLLDTEPCELFDDLNGRKYGEDFQRNENNHHNKGIVHRDFFHKKISGKQITSFEKVEREKHERHHQNSQHLHNNN